MGNASIVTGRAAIDGRAHPDKPIVAVLDGATEMTGSLLAVRRQAALLREEAEFILLLTRDSRVQTQDVPEFSAVLRLPGTLLRRSVPSVLLYLPRLLASARRVRKILATHHCDRLQVNDYYLMEGVVARLMGYSGRIVTWVRIEPGSYGGPLCRPWLWLARRASDQMVAVSRFIQSRLKGSTTRLIYDPAPAPERGTLGWRKEPRRRFVMIGNYMKGKGQDLAIQAFHQIALDYPAAELVFHGSDMGLTKNRAYLSQLRSAAVNGPGADRIFLNNFVEDTFEALQESLCALILSRSESFSLACQEASASGTAVIATRCGGPEEIVADGISGYLIPVGDVEAIASAMRRILADPRSAQVMGRRGAALVRERFSAERFRSEMIEVLALRRGNERDRPIVGLAR